MDGTKLTNDISWFFSVYQSRTERLRRILPASVREELDEELCLLKDSIRNRLAEEFRR